MCACPYTVQLVQQPALVLKETKLMVGSDDEADLRSLRLGEGKVKCVKEFKYLGSIVEAG